MNQHGGTMQILEENDMFRTISRLVPIAVLVSAMLGSAAAAQSERPPETTPLTAYELLLLYGGKTWMWSTGGGYMDKDRGFVGWVEDGGVRTDATGRWRITDNGRLCIEARWSTGSDATDGNTCFLHARSADGTIHQRSTRNGEWYVFKHATTQETDEYLKLVLGNQVPAPTKN
jgi:hypothetical protein